MPTTDENGWTHYEDGSSSGPPLPPEEAYLRVAIVKTKGCLHGGEAPDTLQDLYGRHAMTVDEMAQAALLAIKTAIKETAENAWGWVDKTD